MRNITGPPVAGDDFFGREAELGRLRRAVEAGNHVLLLGPRRVGKSSILAELARQLDDDGWKVVKVDVQDVTDEAAFLDALLRGIRTSGIELPLLVQATGMVRKFRDVLRGTKIKLAGAQVEIGEGSADWEDASGSLKQLIPTLPDQGWLVSITVDELPVFLSQLLEASDGVERVKHILHWLRGVRQACGTRLPWILCGSIGLDAFVAQHGLAGTINDLQPQGVDAFEAEVAVQCLQQLAATGPYDMTMSDDVAQAIVTCVGWPVPFYLQLMFHALAELPPSQRSTNYPAVADVKAAYATLLDVNHSVHFAHWDTRLRDLLDRSRLANARLLLKHLCQLPRGSERRALFNLLAASHPHADPDTLDDLLRHVLDFLERDGYLIRQGDAYAFRAFLLRDYWKERFAS